MKHRTAIRQTRRRRRTRVLAPGAPGGETPDTHVPANTAGWGGFRPSRGISLRVSLSLACAVGAVLCGCRHQPSDEAATAPPIVTVAQPVSREVTDYVEFIGRTEAPFSLEVRARVTGYLVKMPFREGAEVKAGEVLFEIDERPYKAELDQAQAGLERAKAALVKAQAFLDMGLQTEKMSAGAVSQQEIVQRQGARDEAAADVNSAQATLENAQLNYDWCKVTSSIDGRVSRYNLTLGNLVTQDSTLLTTVVSQDPLHVYFDVDEATMLRIVRHLLPNETDLIEAKQVPVLMALADEQGFPHTGYVDFADNVVSTATGTVKARGVFANPAMPSGRRLLRPGMFVRVRLPIGKPRQALLVSEKALGTDQGQKYVYVVDRQNLVQYQPVKLGALQSDGLRVIEEGLQPGQWILISGLQLVRPHQQVKLEQAAMPFDAAAGQAGKQGGQPQPKLPKPPRTAPKEQPSGNGPARASSDHP